MKLVWKILVTISLQGRTYRDDIHSFFEVSGAIMSWRVAKELNKVPPQYHILKEYYKPRSWKVPRYWHWRVACKGVSISIQWIDKYKRKRTLTIPLLENAEWFSAKAPWSISFAYPYHENYSTGIGLISAARYHIPSDIMCANSDDIKTRNTWHQTVCGVVKAQQTYTCTESGIYQSSTPAEAVHGHATLKQVKHRFSLSCMQRKGYHQCLMDEQGRWLTTSPVAEYYNRWMAEAFERLSEFHWIVDDFVT